MAKVRDLPYNQMLVVELQTIAHGYGIKGVKSIGNRANLIALIENHVTNLENPYYYLATSKGLVKKFRRPDDSLRC